jgi:hypothetical protein
MGTEVEKFENMIAELGRKRVASVQRGTELADERAAIALAACTVARPARTISTICSIVKPCASRIASVQPSRQEASSSKRAAAVGLRTTLAAWHHRELSRTDRTAPARESINNTSRASVNA